MVTTLADHELMTVRELAAVLRVSPVHAYALLEQADIPHVRLSERRIRVPRAAFEEWLTARTCRAERHKEILSQ